jgi:hypothetical protein
MSIKSKFPSIKPSLLLDFANVKQLDPRVTFVRTTTATYYDGKTTAKAEQNLLLRSQDFTTSWVNTSFTSTAGVTAPDGTTTAFTANEGAVAATVHSTHLVPAITASSIMTFSVFAKNVNARYIGLAINTAQNNYGTVEFDLDGSGAVNRTAVAGTGFSIISSSITAVGSGWFRCVAVIAVGSASVSDGRATIYISDGTSSFDNRGRPIYAGTNRTLEIWGAQLEQRSAVTAYTPTTTQPITNYIPVLLTAPAGVARFDHNPTTGESLGLLIEEQRTNLFTYSDDFADASWVKTRASITSNTIVAPDGTLTGDKFVENTDTNTHDISFIASLTSGTAYTISFFVKSAGRNLRMYYPSGAFTSAFSSIFDLTNGTVTPAITNSVGSITSFGNGWFRCVMTQTATATTTGTFTLRLIEGASTTSYTGDGFSGIYIWGAQLEAGAFPTSYIPTVAATVTRNADAATMTGTNFSSWYRADEGTLYAEASTAPSGGTAVRRALVLDDGTSNNRMTFGFAAALNGRNFTSTVSNSLVVNIFTTAAVTAGVPYKLAGNYAVDNYAFAIDGAAIGTDTSGAVPVVNTARIGQGSAGEQLNGHIRKISFYPSRLSDSQLQALTA